MRIAHLFAGQTFVDQRRHQSCQVTPVALMGRATLVSLLVLVIASLKHN
jgi:hypothetical protein